MPDSKHPSPVPKPDLGESDGFRMGVGARGSTTQTMRRTTTATRIAALVADAGLGCRFHSIVSSSGLPFAELAVLYATDGERSHGEGTIIRSTNPRQLIEGGAQFRVRACVEFAGAAGLHPAVRLFLPYYCNMGELEGIGLPLAEVLSRARLSPSRVIAEVLVPPTVEAYAATTEHVARLRDVGVQVAVRVGEPDDRALDLIFAVEPDFVHIVRPPRHFDAVENMRAFVAQCGQICQGSCRAIVGGLETADDTAEVERIGVSLYYGDAISAPRFLC
ncbi:MAG: EAL domain-containing protein [Polyangiaceae bacterium]